MCIRDRRARARARARRRVKASGRSVRRCVPCVETRAPPLSSAGLMFDDDGGWRRLGPRRRARATFSCQRATAVARAPPS
eukprot:9931361-Lingulodinium_polyedra.AAC.1